jgi:hypothetical protein
LEVPASGADTCRELATGFETLLVGSGEETPVTDFFLIAAGLVDVADNFGAGFIENVYTSESSCSER